MRKIIPLLLCSYFLSASAQNGVLSGKIFEKGQPVAFALCAIVSLNAAATADEKGNFSLKGLPEGHYELNVTCLGYFPHRQQVSIPKSGTLTVNIELEEAPFSLNTVVVSGTRTDRRRLDNPVAVNVLTSGSFQVTQSNTLSEGLCFLPGLRMETDCQTCNYTQLRMNGLGGSYSQILIDNRPVFTPLMSLYSLEQIPASQIERVEVVKGGGSVLYGANAIAGTVNVLTKMPTKNEWSIAGNTAIIDGQSSDHFFNGNASIINEEKTAGISFFTSHRNREAYDNSGDGFSELPQLRNNSFGFKANLKPSPQHKLQLNGWSINEFRRGGNAFDLPADQADQSEERSQQVWIGGADYQFTPKNGKTSLNTYLAAQQTTRRHYTGIDHADGWGNTNSKTWTGGVQINRKLDYWGGQNALTVGIEHQHDDTFDEIEAYNYLIDQVTDLTGLFLQSDWDITQKFTLLSGIRLNKHNFLDNLVATPRLSALFKPFKNLQLRAGWAQGFRAPQAFETDMHIAFAGGGVSIIQVSPLLKPEGSNSYSFSLDFNRPSANHIYGFTLDAFRTRLLDAFVLEENGSDTAGNILLLRKNGGNSTVQGLTFEARFNYDQKAQLEMGLTLQTANFDNPVAWSAEVPGSRKFLRTPDRYGFFTLIILPEKKLNSSFSGVYTGKMMVPHFGGAPGVGHDALFRSPEFMELNAKVNYRLHLHSMETDLEFSAGVQSIFDAYQSDFDNGKYRDSNYIYGPARPRTVFLAVKFGVF
ncbi:MAG: TonB-dependent receptor [Saprospiraceae bacterium]|nr:TonB-dependent receptor [Saprospiraceae bacterium]MCF8249876.1 TonB-dependent receptor [Saprospiraceae bacterium]MCF8279454.1 TonB-dependent receptor [Bacteroidales bacterium]MCF8311690.1 TonB-dependent receptor [Saprospiraceae bacterium]MCF8440257.1 TonB-dependent receptor [Saprospiraceae bacterium]